MYIYVVVVVWGCKDIHFDLTNHTYKEGVMQ